MLAGKQNHEIFFFQMLEGENKIMKKDFKNVSSIKKKSLKKIFKNSVKTSNNKKNMHAILALS